MSKSSFWWVAGRLDGMIEAARAGGVAEDEVQEVVEEGLGLIELGLQGRVEAVRSPGQPAVEPKDEGGAP